MLKRGIASMLAAIFLMFPMGAVNGEETFASRTVGFTDLADSHWAATQILQAVDKGYVLGFPDRTFRPDEKVTQAQFMRMLVDALKLPHVEQGRPWYQPYVASLLETEILQPGEFQDVESALTRLEMFRLAVRAFHLELAQEDASDQALLIAGAEAGLIHGTGQGDLNLHGEVSRAEAVVVMERLLSAFSGEKLDVNEKAIEAAKSMQMEGS